MSKTAEYNVYHYITYSGGYLDKTCSVCVMKTGEWMSLRIHVKGRIMRPAFICSWVSSEAWLSFYWSTAVCSCWCGAASIISVKALSSLTNLIFKPGCSHLPLGFLCDLRPPVCGSWRDPCMSTHCISFSSVHVWRRTAGNVGATFC